MLQQTQILMRNLCLRLLHAETEEEVVSILKESGYWDDLGAWRDYGDIPNNRSIVGNQQSEPVAALVEKVVNSIDAVLTAECHRRGIDPTSAQAPRTMHEAVAVLLSVPGGRIRDLTARERTQLGDRIQLVACGTKEAPAYVVVDDGEGQTPQEFPSTFLSLVRENKTRIAFVQGKFNMGGTGVLQFAGTHGFQLIISRRQPDLPAKKDDATRHLWGFTLIRRLDPDERRPQSVYVYLAPEGLVPTFDAESLALRPGRYPNAYSDQLAAGTCIKVWNYRVRGRIKSIITLDMRYALERHLQEPALPFRVYERRSRYQAHSYETTISGLSNVLFDRRDDIELAASTPLRALSVGDVSVCVSVVKEKLADEGERYPPGVFFLVNGQLHGELGKGFIVGRTKFDYIADSMIVTVDCTRLPYRIREDLFMASRDRMRECPEREALQDAIAEYLREHRGLRELNARRRQARLAAAISQEETAKVVQNIVRADPTLAELFQKGSLVRVVGKDLPQPEPYEGRRFPTFFKIRNEPKGGLLKPCAKNHTCRVEFETDAANDYFDRISDPGHMEIRGAVKLVSRHLWNGRAFLRFALPENGQVGDRYGIEVEVADVSRVDPLKSRLSIQVEEEGPDRAPKEPSPRKESKLIGLPNVQEVRRDQWAEFGFTEISAVQLRSGEDDSIDMYINMDNIYLRNEIARRRDVDPALLAHWFKWGLCFLALGILHREETREAENGDKEADSVSTFEAIGKASEGLAITVIPVMAKLAQTEGVAA